MLTRLALPALMLAAVAPGGARAASSTHTTPWLDGPKGGDQFNMVSADRESGRLTLLRLQPPLVSGGLGCGGKGGFATFEVRGITDPIVSVSLQVEDAAWNPFTWLTLSVRSTDASGASHFLGTTKVRGPGAGATTVDLAIAEADRVPPGRAQTVRFGMEVATSCIPNVDGGSAIFRSVTVETA